MISFFKKFVLLSVIFLSCFSVVFAQELLTEEPSLTKASVVEIIEQGEREIFGTGTKTSYQIIKAEILEGEQEGVVVEVENDYILLNEGEKFFLKYSVIDDETGVYSVHDTDRSGALYFFVGLFVFVVILFGRMKGLRSLLSLTSSFFIIIFLFLPRVLDGASPVLTSIIFSIFILIFAIYLTHGFNKKSTAAILGAVIAIIFTGLLAKFAIYFTRLTGFASDEAVYLNFATQGSLNFEGLLLGAVIIGVLGILDDVAITQASCVAELKKVSSDLSRREVYKKALNIGRDHVGALINTLALAYMGVAMPLILFLYNSDIATFFILNKEVFATEIIRTIVGSIGLILTVPITTLIAVLMFVRKK